MRVMALAAAFLLLSFAHPSQAQTLGAGLPWASPGLGAPGRFQGMASEERLGSFLSDPASVGNGSTLGVFVDAAQPASPAAAPSVVGAARAEFSARAVPAATAQAPAPASALRQLRRVEEQARRLPRHVKALDERQREELYRAVAGHPVAGLEHVARYDPSGEIGFCFGRAMAAHLLALRMGLSPDSIRKIFIVGDLRSADGVAWRFHVAALVRGTDGAWHAIDPIAPGPLELGGWARFVQDGYDKERGAKLYMTPAEAVMPDLHVVPAPGSESGERIIELSFEPEGRQGFEKLPGLPDARTRAFQAGGESVARHFDTTLEGRESFDFLRAAVNGQEYRYRGYFTDLLEAILLQPAPGARCPFQGPLCGAPGPVRACALPAPGGGLFSPKMASW